MLTRWLTCWAAAAVALALLLGGGAAPTVATAPSAVAGAPGIGDPYFPLDGNGGIDVLSYDVHDGYRFGDRRIRGWTRVTLRATERLSSFDLDFLLPVSSVRLSTGRATFAQPDGHELVITPAHPIPTGGTVRARIAYSGHPDRQGWEGEHNWVADDAEVVAVNEPHMAAWWFPSDDHPLDKARMDLHLTVPRADRVIANGRLVGVRRDGAHTTYHWSGGGPMATYLAFFAAGRFEVRHGVHRGLPWYVAVSRQLPTARRRAVLHGLLQTPHIVGWLQRHLGPYPFAETGGVVTELNPGFSLETQTRPTYPLDVFATLMVHELAHQWFGDSVSVHHWRDIWLNEGFATFMEALWTESHGGVSIRRWLHETYAANPDGTELWKLRISDPGPGHLFDQAVYERGALALAALRERMGHPAFARLLRAWTRQHRHGHGTTAAFEALAVQIHGPGLRPLFRAWLDVTGRPADSAADGL
ncbi:M1 family metallopeptidase [Nocardioides cynanchi]|uniref:M1 family metallopeptidase n=1 Tax=Nocardioides cynanchi TaxID=2558918 RepID=UPI001247930C|nr:M1 family metallopeptidase [Nocardioides cynanchi]